MEEDKEKNGTGINTEELRNEATNTVNQVKDTIKNVDFKKDGMETKGFIVNFIKNPISKINEIATGEKNKYFTYALIIVAIWVIAIIIKNIFSVFSALKLKYLGGNLLSLVKLGITPILSILTMSCIIYILNKEGKKNLVTTISTIVTANIPKVVAAVVSLLTLIGSKISLVTTPFTSICNAISIILTFFAIKSLCDLKENETEKIFSKFLFVEIAYYVVYIVFSLFNIYI